MKILFSRNQAPYIRERRWHRGQEITENEDGTVTLSFVTHSSMELEKWVLSWGAEARVLEPGSLANKIEEEARKMVQNYKN